MSEPSSLYSEESELPPELSPKLPPALLPALPPAFDMWQMFHNIITASLKNLDNAESNLQALAKTLLSSKESSDIFKPRYDSMLSYEQNQTIENTYQTFTTWLLGRLFYVLSCDKFERIHDILIEAQEKILIVLQLSYPHIYNTLIKEYNDALTTVNKYLNSWTEQNQNSKKESVFINNFISDHISFNENQLILTPIFVELESQNSCFSLQPKILKILTQVSLLYTQSFWLDSTARSILNNIVFCLHNSKPPSKIIVVEYLMKSIRLNYFQIKRTPLLDDHFQELYSCLETIIFGFKNNDNQFKVEEIEIFDSALSNLFDIIVEYEIIKENNFILVKCKNMCHFLIIFKLLQNNISKSKQILLSSMKLLTSILLYENNLYSEINFILNYAINNKSCDDVNILLHYQIFEEVKKEIKDNSIDVLAVSPTWQILYNELISNFEKYLNEKEDNFILILELLYFTKSIMNTVQIIYYMIREYFFEKLSQNYSGPLQVNFFPIGAFVEQLNNIINKYNITIKADTQHCLDFIVDTLSSIISVTYFSQPKLQNLYDMVKTICYPFYKLQQFSRVRAVNSFFIMEEFSEERYVEQQLKTIEMLSICLLNADLSNTVHMKEIKTWIIAIYKHCATSTNSRILIQVSHKLLFLLSTLKEATTTIYEIIKHLLNSNNLEVLKVLSESLGKIVCVLSGNFTISPQIIDNCITYDVFCLQCDFTKNIDDPKKRNDEQRKLYRISDNKCFAIAEFIAQKNLIQNADVSMIINLLDSTDVNVKINIVEQLPRFVKHINKFNTILVTNKWLKFIEDEDRNVREKFISVVKPVMDNCQNNNGLSENYKENMLDVCLKKLISVTQQHIRSGNADLIETVLDTINEFGCLNNFAVVYITSKLIIFYLILCNNYLSVTAIDHLKSIAKCHNITPNFIFHKYKKSLCQAIVNNSVVAYVGMEYNVVQSLDRTALAFGFTMKEFLTRNMHHLLPYFIPCFVRAPVSRKILNDIANWLVIEASALIANSFSYIYTYVYLNESNDIFESCMELIEQITKRRIRILKKRSLKVIYNELLLHFHDKKELVLEELYKLSVEETDSNSHRSSTPSSNKTQQISEYLQPRFLGVLVYFDTKLVVKNVDDAVKIRVLQSLPIVIELMGTKFITSLRHKVLATLRTALSLTEKKYLELTCNIWDTFVHCCEVDSLGPLLSTIFVSILPLLDLFPKKINGIFKYLIVDNNEKLKDHIQDLFFFSETKVDNELKRIIRNYVPANQNRSCKEQLIYFFKYINHENLEVRVYGLKFLKKYLEEKHAELEELIVGNNGMDAVLVEVIDVLIAGCRENDEQVRLACGQCIGELGAIEPSHFPRRYTTQSDSDFTFYLADDTFVVNALSELLRLFQMEKHTQNMNRFALAIQEILKEYEVSPDEAARKHILWNLFPKSMQELMLPLLSSRYTVTTQSTEKIWVHPIFGSHFGSTSNDWINNWSSHLISLLTNEKKQLLQVCKPSLKYDYRTLMIFLPHILIHAILECTNEERDQIFEEFMAVLNYADGKKKIDPKQLKFQPLKTKQYVASNTTKKPDDTSKTNCIKVIFVLLDYIGRWLREYECQKCPRLVNPMLDKNYKTIHTFMARFCKLKIAQCNYLRGEYPRSLMYLEQHVSGEKNKLNEHLGFFARIYAELEEPDGVAGAMAMKETDPSIEDMILAHNVSGQLQDAIACYERMAQEHTLQPQYLQDMVRCYLEIDNPYTALNIASAAMEKYAEHETMLHESQAEPFWRLSMYDEMSDLMKKPGMKNNNSWGVRMGQALIHFRNGNRIDFRDEISNVQKMLIEMLSITSIEEGVYTHSYPHIIKLHILNELQKAEEIVYKLKEMTDITISERTINELIEEWDLRLKVVQSSVRVVEPILRMRRIILEQTQHVLGPQSEPVKATLDNHIAKYWLKSAEIARRANIFQQAYIYILKAEQYKPMELFVEKAKLYWAKDDQDLAFSTLQRGVEEHFSDVATFKDMDPSLRKNDRKLCAEAKLLIATYNDETSNVDMDVNIANYRAAVEMYREWEKSQVCLAQYYDRVFTAMTDVDKDLKQGELQIHMINSFGKSLQYGSTYIYQSMPRMLSIWFDYGTRITESKPTDSNEAKAIKRTTLFKMNKLIDAFLDRLPAYMFLSAFSQLVSRICHPVREVYVQVKSILIKLILKYPQHSMWMIMAVSKSCYAMRTKRCQEVFQDERIRNSRYMNLIYDFNRLAEKLIELCNKPISDGIERTSVNALIRTLPRLLQNKDFSEIMVPIQRLTKLVLPNPEYSNSQYNPFPNNMVYIVNIDDEVQVLSSLQRPRKITFRGSNGKKYIHMLKPKDDLRKDCRLMEFNDVVNLYLHREAESRQRRLCIRTYAVVPLNEECGIIEWVDNLVGLRAILMNIYKQRDLYVNNREIKTMMCAVRDPLAKKRDIFENKLLRRHPPVLSEWFRRTFPDAHSWYHARTAYVRTSAVYSMVGYVLGLGDRHGENILFDSTNGDTVHVDFNCLFNKGENFDWPEKVPFRLTHNMVEAMGPLGVEGIFRKTCAVTLRVLRTHTDTLMSIVRPFVYDPLVSWPRNQLMKSDLAEAERTNEQAVEHIQKIQLRLQGMIKVRGKSYSISLSCEGQANNLILEATSVDNLCQMYIGWGPYL